LVAAGVLIRDDAGRVLLVKPTYKDGWDIPGGYVEPGESPAAAAVREMAEELGLHRIAGRLLVVDWAPHPTEGDKLLFVFNGGSLAEADLTRLKLQASEIAEVQLFPASELEQQMPARLSRRLHLALAAAATGRIEYAEHGSSVTS
jgi:8-oxo-dGTP diphosphatase